MTGSLVKVSVLVLALAMPAAWAQSAAPPDKEMPPVLTPDDYPPVADEPPATAPPQTLPGTANLPAALPPQNVGVEVGTLGTAEGPPAGLLDSSNGGLGNDIWSGTARATAEDLLQRAPLASADPALRALTKRLVLTKAAAPFGPAKRAFVTVRIAKLLDAGLIDDAGALAAQAAVPNDDDFARAQADALLTAGRGADVCGPLTATRLTAGDPFWLQLRAYCAAAGGDQPTADLTNSVLQAQGHGNAAYDTLVDDVLNHKATPPVPIVHPSAIHLFLLQLAGMPIPPGVAAAMGTPANLLVMRDPRQSSAVRLQAAERILRTGAANVTELKVLMDAQDIPLARIANVTVDAPALPFLEGQAILRRAALIEPRPEAKAELVAQALSLGEKAGLLPLAAGLQADVIASLKPGPASQSAAPVFARALLLAGRPDAAARWLGDKDGPAAQILIDLAAPNPPRDAKAQAAMSAFASSLTQIPPVADPYKPYEALLMGVADVLGRPMPPDAKAQAPGLEAQRWDGKRPDTDLMRAIEQASLRPDRRGEAFLMILDAVHDIGLRDMAPDATVEFVRLLGAMGVPDSAYALAMDALTQYVPPPVPPAPSPPVAAQ